MNQVVYDAYMRILQAELVPAFGCTEPISIALAGAKVRETLDAVPEHVFVYCSGNIVKNAKSVIVPCSGGLKGIEAAVWMGIVCGDSAKGLEVLNGATNSDIEQVKALLAGNTCSTSLLQTGAKLHIIVRGEIQDRFAEVEIRHFHDQIVRVETESGVVFTISDEEQHAETDHDHNLLCMQDICAFADAVNLLDIDPLISRQIEYNTRVSKEGLANRYGANIGRALLDLYGDSVEIKARAAAAAGSDARMSGCELPVIINSGSGNQGMTVSLPVIIYAENLGVGRNKLCRALVLSNLMAIYQKSHIGRLSAYCGAVSASAGAGAGITYLLGGTHKQICDTVTNTIADVSGVLCDGAKPSCAAKIASCIDAAILANKLAMDGSGFNAGDGLIRSTADDTIASIARVAREGMEQTDHVILETMLRQD